MARRISTIESGAVRRRARVSLFAAALAFCCPAAGLAAGPFGGSVTGLVLAADRGAPRWAATWRGLFRSDGKRWARVESLGTRPLTGVLALPGLLLVLPEHGGLLVSEDDGGTWDVQVRGLQGRYGHRVDDVLALSADPADPLHLYLAAAGQGAFESHDGGKKWTLLIAGLEAAPPPAFYPTALLPAEGGRPLLMGTDGAGLYAWKGERWERAGEGLPDRLRVQSLAADPRDPSRIAAATRGAGLWVSRDAGQSWTLARKGAFGIVDALAYGQGGTLLAHFPEDGAVVVTSSGSSPALTDLREAQVLTLAARKDGGWLAGVAHDGVAVLTTDGKRTDWENAGLDATRVGALVPGEQKGTFWAGDSNGVFLSVDDAKSWEARDQGLLGASADAFLWHKGGLYLGSGGQGVYRWSPEKKSWEERSGGLGTANTIFAFVEDAGRDRLYVGTEGGLLRTDDAGASWVHKDAGLVVGPQTLVAAGLGKPGLLWAATGGKLYRSDDAGESWAVVAEANPVALLPQVVAGEERLWILESGRLSAFSGHQMVATALVAGAGEQFTCLAFGGGALWVGSSEGLWSLVDGAARKVWDRAGVRSILPSDGRLLVGTDGRGALSMRVR